MYMLVCEAGSVPFPSHGADRIADVVIVRPANSKVFSCIRRTVVLRRKKQMS